ncbi:TrkH family potassium uptake protein [Romboutsia hominis]|uniref:TrkH family potassium uptake protein n=1 Tax=Romboutsia hominis TaxID=1507512 RepID=UPI001F06A8F0|nr:TrkH family potassium uptake protein [Romboutsia hominis]MCH1959157.1 TrkH family potassium uptake protein [Romboutsia hominis]MCH1968277.1 TrkH family potassium uptake protein [Romboutsia hominis]
MNTIFKRFFALINKMQPTQVMVLGFASVILIGALLLNLPIATQSGESIGFIDALFTSTSAVCVTGLIMADTATYWNGFGHVVIILLIQIGGLGFMTITTLFALITKKRINLKERLLIQESLNQFDLSGLVKLTRYVLLMTITIEGIGALILSTVFIPQFGLLKGTWYSIFHAISAFCNAGFDLMGPVSGKFTSLTYYVNNFTVSVTISLLIIFGGLGFPVILDIIKNRKLSKLNLHSKIVLITTVALILVGTSLILVLEYNNPKTIGNLGVGGKVLASFFQSVTTRTAGFNTVNLTAMHENSLFIMIILMFIGAAPASTGGGVKVTSIATLVLTVKSFILGKEDIEVGARRIGTSIVRKSLGIFLIGIIVVLSGTIIITITDPSFSLIEAGFEVVSAFATVGLSLGGSPNLSTLGKIFIMLFMFMGRVGSLTIFMAIMSRKTKKNPPIRYPEGKIIVG